MSLKAILESTPSQVSQAKPANPLPQPAKKNRINITMDTAIRARAAALAKQRGMSLSALIGLALSRVLDDDKP